MSSATFLNGFAELVFLVNTNVTNPSESCELPGFPEDLIWSVGGFTDEGAKLFKKVALLMLYSYSRLNLPIGAI